MSAFWIPASLLENNRIYFVTQFFWSYNSKGPLEKEVLLELLLHFERHRPKSQKLLLIASFHSTGITFIVKQMTAGENLSPRIEGCIVYLMILGIVPWVFIFYSRF